MDMYICPCGYIYDPSKGDKTQNIAEGTLFQDLPEGWACPICGLSKNSFSKK